MGWFSNGNTFSCLFIRDNSVRLTGMKFQKNKTRMVLQSCNRSRVDSCDFTDEGNFDASEVEVHISQNYVIFTSLECSLRVTELSSRSKKPIKSEISVGRLVRANKHTGIVLNPQCPSKHGRITCMVIADNEVKSLNT